MALLPLCSAVSQRFQQEPFLLPALFRLVVAAQRRTAGESQSQASQQSSGSSSQNGGNSGNSGTSGNSGNSGNEGWVEQVGAMAGCPILLSNAESLDGLDRKNRETVLLARVAASLWLRAVVEVFADCPQSVVRFKVSVLAGNEAKISQRLAALRDLEGNLAPLLALYGLPFVPAGMEGAGKSGKPGEAKPREKKSGLRASPFPPSVCVLLT